MDRENARCIWLFKVSLGDPRHPHMLSATLFLIQNKSLCSFLAGSDRPYPRTTEPINLISKHFPPTCVVAASTDGLIPTEQFRHVYERVNEQGIDALYVECKGMRHAEAECLPLSPEWPEGNTWWKNALLPSLHFALRHMTED
jgi:acetyl esterase/lipase